MLADADARASRTESDDNVLAQDDLGSFLAESLSLQELEGLQEQEGVASSFSPDCSAVLALERAAALHVCTLETALCDVEAHEDAKDADGGLAHRALALVRGVLARAENTNAALELAATLRQAHATALSRTQTKTSLKDAIVAGDWGLLNLGLTLLDAETQTHTHAHTKGLLLYATRSRGRDVVRVVARLLESEAVARTAGDADDLDRKTPLSLAVDNAQLVALLLTNEHVRRTAGECDVDRLSPLEHAVRSGNVASITALLTCPEVVVGVAGAGLSPLQQLLRLAGNNAEIVALLLTCHPVREAAGVGNGELDGETPLMTAVKTKFVSAVAVLLACDAVAKTAGAQDRLGRTALMYAIDHSPELIPTLLSCEQVRLSANALDYQDYSGLSYAIARNDAFAVAELLNCKEIADSAGEQMPSSGRASLWRQTPLMAAVKGFGADCSVIRALLACPQVQQTAFSLKNSDGETAFEKATRLSRHASKPGDSGRNSEAARLIAAFAPPSATG